MTARNQSVNRAPRGPFCQSCSMPMQKPEDFGTDAAGFRTNDYCKFCFKAGAFTEPAMTKEQMIDRVQRLLMEKVRMPEEQAKAMANDFVPKLKRWQEK